MSTAPQPPTVATLSDAEYDRRTEALLSAIEAAADAWLQQDLVDIDTQRTGGLLELDFPDGSHIVVNTQPPLHEVWLATRGGGFHYRWSGGRWCDTKDGSDFHDALSRHASLQSGVELRFDPPAA